MTSPAVPAVPGITEQRLAEIEARTLTVAAVTDLLAEVRRLQAFAAMARIDVESAHDMCARGEACGPILQRAIRGLS